MEEQKLNKEVKINSGNQSKPQKLTYEELNEVCAEMSQQLQQQKTYIQNLHKQMQEMGYALQTKRMDYLFKVLEMQNINNTLFPDEFCSKCAKEIVESLTIPEEIKNTPKDN